MVEISIRSFVVVNGLFLVSGLVWGFILGQLRHRHKGVSDGLEVPVLRLPLPGPGLRKGFHQPKTDRSR